jgi:3-hydroxybutyryl-CoA dehydrogenase
MKEEVDLSVDIGKVAVVGGGIMGSGIAQVIATAGLEVRLVDVDKTALERAQTRIDRSLERFVKSSKLTQAEADDVRGRIVGSIDLSTSAAWADHAVETVVEDLDIKGRVLKAVDEALPAGGIIASNTSQFPISVLATYTTRPALVIGSHWFNPPPMMDLIEIIRGIETSDATVATALELAKRFGKTTIVCTKDTPGFITSRLMIALGLEAARIVEEGIATAEDVNLACVKAFNHAMGPLDTLDFSGLDTSLHVANNMREQYGERFLPPQIIRALVSGGHLGRKTGRGFRAYN